MMIYPVHREKRKVTRTKISSLVTCSIFDATTCAKSREVESITLDLNEHGVSLLTDLDVGHGTRVTVTFHVVKKPITSVQQEYRMIKFYGTVIHAAPHGSRLKRLGILFNNNYRFNETKFFEIICSETRAPGNFLLNY